MSLCVILLWRHNTSVLIWIQDSANERATSSLDEARPSDRTPETGEKEKQENLLKSTVGQLQLLNGQMGNLESTISQLLLVKASLSPPSKALLKFIAGQCLQLGGRLTNLSSIANEVVTVKCSTTPVIQRSQEHNKFSEGSPPATRCGTPSVQRRHEHEYPSADGNPTSPYVNEAQSGYDYGKKGVASTSKVSPTSIKPMARNQEQVPLKPHTLDFKSDDVSKDSFKEQKSPDIFTSMLEALPMPLSEKRIDILFDPSPSSRCTSLCC